MFSLLLGSLLLALLLLPFLRTSPVPVCDIPDPPPARRVSFVSPPSPDPSLQKQKPPPPDPPTTPPPRVAHLAPSSSPPSLTKHRRHPSTPLRLSLSRRKRRSASASYPPALIHVDQPTTHVRSLPPISPPNSSPPSRRPRFKNPFSKASRSRTLSPPDSTSPGSLTSSSPTSSPPAGRRMLVSKLKSIFKPTASEPSPNDPPAPIARTKSRRKLAARTQPYAPPWNAQMPTQDSVFARTTPLSQKHSFDPTIPPAKSSTSPSQLSPRTFIDELDEKLALLQHQRIKKLIPPVTDTVPR